MYTDRDSDALNPDEVLNAVGDPEAFIEELRAAHRDRQYRRNLFVDSLSPDVKAEWIEGEAVYHSPAREAHNAATEATIQVLGVYSDLVSELLIRVEKAMVEIGQHNFEPDICVYRAADHSFSNDQVIYPRPDLVVEVLSKRTRERDFGIKKSQYEQAGVEEYWIVDADKQEVTQFTAKNDGYGLGEILNTDSTLKCIALSSLQFPVSIIWDRQRRLAWKK